MFDYLITRNGVHYFSRRVPAKLAAIIGKKLWRETLATSDRTAAAKAAALRNADCEHEIATALIEYRRQRSAVARLTVEEREVVQEAGGLTALRRETLGLDPNIATVWRSFPDRIRNGLPREWSELASEKQAHLTALWTALPSDERRRHMTRATGNYGLKNNVHFAEAVADMLSSMASASRQQLAEEGINADDLQEELSQAGARAATLRSRLERNLAILRKGTDEVADPELAPNDPEQRAANENLQTVLDRWAKESGAPDQGRVRQAGVDSRCSESAH
jgi:hypothetical protein